MKIEVVGYYEKKTDPKKRSSVGSMHIYIIDLDLDLRGIEVIKKGPYIYFNLPFQWGEDEDTGKRVRYPILNFTDKEKNRALMKSIIEEGKRFFKKNK